MNAERPTLSAGQLAVLDTIERAIRGIHHKVDIAECFRVQCHIAVEAIGLYAVGECPMDNHRRVDLVITGAVGTYALECDRFKARKESLGKFRDLPVEVVRVLVLRRRNRHPEALPYVDRIICVESSMKPLVWLTTGGGIPVEAARDSVRQFLDDRRDENLVSWRRALLTGPRKGPLSTAQLSMELSQVERRRKP